MHYNVPGLAGAVLAEAPKVRRNPAESGGLWSAFPEFTRSLPAVSGLPDHSLQAPGHGCQSAGGESVRLWL